MAPPKIELPTECNRDLILGQVVSALNSLCESNKEEHDKIFKRLDEGDQYLFIFKASRCTFSWLNRNGFVKWGAIASAFTAIGLILGKL